MNAITKSIGVAVLAASAMGVAAAVSAMPPDGGYGCGHGGQRIGLESSFDGKGHRLERLASRLNMSDEQRAEVKAIMEDSRDEMVALRKQMRANRADIRDLARQDAFDEAALRRIADAQGELTAEMIVLRVRQRAEMRSVLSEEQIAQLDKMRERKKGWRRGY